MRFNEIKGDNGTSLQARAESLIEQAEKNGVMVIAVFAGKGEDQSEFRGVHCLASDSVDIPNTLRRVADSMDEAVKQTKLRASYVNQTDEVTPVIRAE